MIQMIKPRTTLDGSFSVYGSLKTFVPVYLLSFLLFTFWRHRVSENFSSQFVLLLAQGLCRNWVPSPPPFPRWRRVSEASKSKLRQSARPVEPRQMSPGMVILIRCRPCCPPKYLTDKLIMRIPSASLFSVESCTSPHREAHLTSDVFSQIWRLSSHLQQVQSDLDLEKLLCQEANDNSVSIY